MIVKDDEFITESFDNIFRCLPYESPVVCYFFFFSFLFFSFLFFSFLSFCLLTIFFINICLPGGV